MAPPRREALEAALDAAARGGPMPFETFMELALYHPEGGFYTRPEMCVGAGGDFHTSPTIHPAYGTCLARELARLWRELGSPRELSVVELGAGSGQLAEQILAELDRLRGGWRSVRYTLVERSPSLRDRQRARLRRWRWKVRWVDDPEALAPAGRFEGVVLTNELFDALSVRRVIGLPEGFGEIGVMRGESGRWRQVAMTPTTPRLAETLEWLGVRLREGQQAEINLHAQDLMRRLARWLGRGFVLTIDYGGEASEVYQPNRLKGTIRGYYRQLRLDDPLLHPGEQDLTADVDFTTLRRIGEEEGLRTVEFTTQGEWLERLGIQELEAEAMRGLKNSLEADFAVSAIRKLYRMEAMGGGFRVLVQSKGLPPAPGTPAR